LRRTSNLNDPNTQQGIKKRNVPGQSCSTRAGSPKIHVCKQGANEKKEVTIVNPGNLLVSKGRTSKKYSAKGGNDLILLKGGKTAARRMKKSVAGVPAAVGERKLPCTRRSRRLA